MKATEGDLFNQASLSGNHYLELFDNNALHEENSMHGKPGEPAAEIRGGGEWVGRCQASWKTCQRFCLASLRP